MKNKSIVMTTRELADYIKVHEKTVIKQAQEGKLPGVKIGNQWRFHLDVIDEYLRRNVVKMPEGDLNEIIKEAEHIIPVSRLIEPELIDLEVDVENKDELLESIALIAKKANIISEHKDFVSLLKEREDLISTAIGEGIAIPHLRHPVSGMFKRPYIMIARTKQAIDFDAPDNKKVTLFFVICATNEFVHLRLLSKIAKFLNEKNLRTQIFKSKNRDELIRIILEFDRKRMFSLM